MYFLRRSIIPAKIFPKYLNNDSYWPLLLGFISKKKITGNSEYQFTFFVRSSNPEVLYKIDVLKNFAKFTGKHLCQSPGWGLQLYEKRDPGTGVFLWILQDFKNSFFYRTTLVVTSFLSTSSEFWWKL